MLAGWLYYRFFYANNGWDRAAGGIFSFSWLRRTKARPQSPRSTVTPISSPNNPPNLRAEVDRILDKINSHGFGALTEQEKRLLDEAKDLLSRR